MSLRLTASSTSTGAEEADGECSQFVRREATLMFRKEFVYNNHETTMKHLIFHRASSVILFIREFKVLIGLR